MEATKKSLTMRTPLRVTAFIPSMSVPPSPVASTGESIRTCSTEPGVELRPNPSIFSEILKPTWLARTRNRMPCWSTTCGVAPLVLKLIHRSIRSGREDNSSGSRSWYTSRPVRIWNRSIPSSDRQVPIWSQMKRSFFLGSARLCSRLTEKPRYSSYKVNPSPLCPSPSGSFSESSSSANEVTSLSALHLSAMCEFSARLGNKIGFGVFFESEFR